MLYDQRLEVANDLKGLMVKTIWLFAALIVLIICPATQGQDAGFQVCTEDETWVLLNTLLDCEILGDTPAEKIDDLVNNGRSQLEAREKSYSLLPLCDEAIDSHRRIIMLKGDIVGGSALMLAGVSRDANPYFWHNLLDTRRIDHILALGTNVDQAPEPEQRRIPFCTADENIWLDDLVSGLQAILMVADDGIEEAQSITEVDNLLVWRDENMPQLPECAQAIELGYLLNKVATDSVAMFAFNYAGVSQEDNPYFDTVTLAMRGLESWRDDLKLTRPEYEGATALALGQAGALPSCTPNELATVHSLVVGKVMDVIRSSQRVETAADLVAYGEAHIGLRDGTLAGLPLCHEIFEIGWLARQVLGDIISRNALNLFGFPTKRNPFSAQVDAKMGGISAWREEKEEYLSGIEVIKGPAAVERELPVCSDGEILLVIGYLLPGYRSFIDEAFALETFGDLYALFDHSFAFRDRLWRELPRCQEALEIGMVMQQVAGDWVALMSVDASEAAVEGNPYLAELERDMALINHLRQGLGNVSESAGSVALGGTIYYVTADPYVEYPFLLRLAASRLRKMAKR